MASQLKRPTMLLNSAYPKLGNGEEANAQKMLLDFMLQSPSGSLAVYDVNADDNKLLKALRDAECKIAALETRVHGLTIKDADRQESFSKLDERNAYLEKEVARTHKKTATKTEPERTPRAFKVTGEVLLKAAKKWFAGGSQTAVAREFNMTEHQIKDIGFRGAPLDDEGHPLIAVHETGAISWMELWQIGSILYGGRTGWRKKVCEKLRIQINFACLVNADPNLVDAIRQEYFEKMRAKETSIASLHVKR